MERAGDCESHGWCPQTQDASCSLQDRTLPWRGLFEDRGKPCLSSLETQRTPDPPPSHETLASG